MKTTTKTPAVPFLGGERCYACDARPVGIRDRSAEGGSREVACTRHADPAIRVFAACMYCSEARPSRVIDYYFAHASCHAEACA